MRPAAITLALLVFAAFPGHAVPTENNPAEADREVSAEPGEAAGEASSRTGPERSAGPQADAPRTASPRLSDDEIRELDVIRRRLRVSPLQGGLWSGTVGGNSGPTDSDFAGQLRQSFGDPQRGQRTRDLNRQGSHEGSADSRRVAALRQYSLRSLSRRLDMIALDMEELRLYDEADRVRELSRQLREQSPHSVD